MADYSERNLDLETRAARALRDVLLTITDDDGAVADTIEGETNLHEAIKAVMDKITEDEILVTGIGSMAQALADRKARIAHRIERRRAAIERGMSVGEIQRLELPLATLSLRRIPPALQIANEAVIPPEYFLPQPPKLDRTALKEALKAGKDVPGALLDNGGIGLTVRRA